MNVKAVRRIEGVKVEARQSAFSLLDTANSRTSLPEPTDISADACGGIEVSWVLCCREVLLSVAMSRDDIPPDTYIMLIDRKQKDRKKRFRTFRKNLDDVLSYGISWLTEIE